MIHDDLFVYNKIIKAEVIINEKMILVFTLNKSSIFFLYLKGLFVANGKKQFYRGYT